MAEGGTRGPTTPLLRSVAVMGRRWALKGGTSLVDQGLYSGAFFLLNILAARWLPQEEYGAFSVGYSVSLFLAALYTALLLEPMAVFGAGIYAQRLRRYFTVLLMAHTAVAMVLSMTLALLAAGMAWMGSALMARSLAGLAVILPLLLLFWLVRRGFYVDTRPHLALGASAGFCAVLFLFLALGPRGAFTSFTLFIMIGAASLAASAAFLLFLRPRPGRGRAGGAEAAPGPLPAAPGPLPAGPSFREVAREHWRYGSWNLLATCLYWGGSQIISLLIPIFLGLGASAVFAAASNLFKPLSLIMQSITLLLLPTLSSRLESNPGSPVLARKTILLAGMITAAGCVYCLLAVIFSGPLMGILYAGRYGGTMLLVSLMAVANTASVAVQVLTVVLKARRATKSTDRKSVV